MRTFYYSLMHNIAAFLLLFGAALICGAQNAPTGSKTSHAAFSDSHEGMSVSVEPWTSPSRYKEKFPKKSPFSAGVVALNVRFQNDNEKGVKVNLQRMRLVVQIDEDNRQELEPLSADDVADTVLLKPSSKDPTARRLPIPVPVAKPKATRDANWTALRDACQNAAIPSGVIGAHGTVEGLVYFDLRGEVDLLRTARLYVPTLLMMDTNQPISYFEIELGQASGSQ